MSFSMQTLQNAYARAHVNTRRKRVKIHQASVVSFLSDSPVVHVEMLPVYRRAGGRGVWVHEAYTAFMGRRFGCYEPNVLDQEETRFLFLPTPPEVGSHGMRFLDSLLVCAHCCLAIHRELARANGWLCDDSVRWPTDGF